MRTIAANWYDIPDKVIKENHKIILRKLDCFKQKDANKFFSISLSKDFFVKVRIFKGIVLTVHASEMISVESVTSP